MRAPHMPISGYARVSTLDQDLAIQRAAIKAVGCGVVRAEKCRRSGRPASVPRRAIKVVAWTNEVAARARQDRFRAAHRHQVAG